MIVVDASVLSSALADDEDDGDRARERLRALAEQLETTLVTADTRLTGAPGLRCEIDLVTGSPRAPKASP